MPSRIHRWSPKALLVACTAIVLSFATGCGVPEHVSFWPVEPECVVDDDCDDDNACTEDVCSKRTCQHADIDPNDKNLCTDDSCDPVMGVVNEPVQIDDQNECTVDAVPSWSSPIARLAPEQRKAAASSPATRAVIR